MQIDIQVLDKRFYFRCFLLRHFCRRVIQNAWQGDEKAIVSVVLADNAFVQDLNKRYRGKDVPTNVLSFENEPPFAGDIVVAYEVMRDEARMQKKRFAAHLAHLLTHGTLHLQGYDHLNDKQANKMENLEIKLLKKMGYSNPYQGA